MYIKQINNSFKLASNFSYKAIKVIMGMIDKVGEMTLNPLSNVQSLIFVTGGIIAISYINPLVSVFMTFLLVVEWISNRRKDNVYDIILPVELYKKDETFLTTLEDYQISDLMYRCRWMLTQYNSTNDEVLKDLIGGTSRDIAESVVYGIYQMYKVRHKHKVRLPTVAFNDLYLVTRTVSVYMREHDIKEVSVPKENRDV